MKPNGFTLVELLFALVTGGLLLVGLALSIRGVEDQYRRYQTPGSAEIVMGLAPLLDAELGHALPPVTGAAFEGDETHLVVTAPPPKALGAVGSVRFALTVETRDGLRSLVSRIEPVAPSQTLPPAATTPVTLASGFRDIQLSYLRRKSDRETDLPRLITIQFVARDRTVLPLGVEPRLTMGADCVFDPIAQACRS